MSITYQKSLAVHDITSVGSTYVNVGAPFVFIRSSVNTPIAPIKRRRDLLQGDGFSLFQTHSGVRGHSFTTVVLESTRDLMSESPKGRLARLFYTHMRTMTFAHSHYLAKLDEGKLPRSGHLLQAIGAMVERIKGLVPIQGDLRGDA